MQVWLLWLLRQYQCGISSHCKSGLGMWADGSATWVEGLLKNRVCIIKPVKVREELKTRRTNWDLNKPHYQSNETNYQLLCVQYRVRSSIFCSLHDEHILFDFAWRTSENASGGLTLWTIKFKCLVLMDYLKNCELASDIWIWQVFVQLRLNKYCLWHHFYLSMKLITMQER